MSSTSDRWTDAGSDLIDLAPVFRYLSRAAKFTLLCVALFAIGGAALGVAFLPTYYRSTAILVPVTENSISAGAGGLSNMLLQFGSVLGISGLSGLAGESHGELAVELIKTRGFAVDFLRRNNLEVPLLAGTRFDTQTGKWLVDPDTYDASSGKWKSSLTNTDGALSETKLYEEYKDRLAVSVSRQSNLISISFESKDPAEAQRWLTLLIRRANDELRERQLRESRRNIEFLKAQAQQTQVSELRTAMFHLASEQMRRLMVAEGQIEFALKTLDPPHRPEKPVRPAWLIGGLIGALIGLILGLSLFPLTKSLRRSAN